MRLSILLPYVVLIFLCVTNGIEASDESMDVEYENGMRQLGSGKYSSSRSNYLNRLVSQLVSDALSASPNF